MKGKIRCIAFLTLVTLLSCSKSDDEVDMLNFMNYRYIDIVENAYCSDVSGYEYIDTVWFDFILPDTLKSTRHYYKPTNPPVLIKKDICVRLFIMNNNKIINGPFPSSLPSIYGVNSFLLGKEWIIKTNSETDLVLDIFDNSNNNRKKVGNNYRLIKEKSNLHKF